MSESEDERISLDALGQLELADWFRIGSGICDALSSLHDAGVVHGDVRPSTIWIDRTSGRAWLPEPRNGPASADPRGFRRRSMTGSLAYLAPEHAGRLASEIDHRADLYSLGVTLYQLATGRLPFAVSDAREWVHAHVVVRPASFGQGAGFPEIVERIVLKLLEKDPEDRYQTAAGVAHDLRAGASQLETSGNVVSFQLGRRDAPGRLSRRPAFRGRAEEITAVARVAERVHRSSRPEVLLVAGFSGIGKSSLVREALARHLPAGAIVGSGKFDEREGDAPYATLAGAFRELCRWALATPPGELAEWKQALLDALAGNAGAVSELVPELQAIIGPQPPPPWVPADEARNRVYASFRRLLRVFAARARPLVLFLDDLQWLDPASLGLIEHLVLDPELGPLLFIGAYRAESVPSDHPLELALGRIRGEERPVERLALPPLPAVEVGQLVAEVLGRGPETTEALADVVERKTGGNPFFVRQFLSALREEGLLLFDRGNGVWAWDLPGIIAHGPTDNLTDLLLDRLARLPVPTQRALDTLACLGTWSPASLLAELSGVGLDETTEALRDAVNAGVLTESAAGYAYSHDRLLTAAYSRIPESERPERHLHIGRLLRNRMGGAADAGPFEAVRHLNRAVFLLSDPAERIALAELNLRFAQRSRAVAASASALVHLEQAQNLLPEDHLESLPALGFEIALARAEAEFLCGEHARAEARLKELSVRKLDAEQRGAVVRVQLPMYAASNRLVEAIDTGLDYLRSVGVPWKAVDADELRRAYERLRRALGSRSAASLAGLPKTTSSSVRTIMEVCAGMVFPSFYGNQQVFALVTMHIATLSIEHGNSDASVIAFGFLGVVLGPLFGEYELGFEFTKLGSELADSDSNRFAGPAWSLMGGAAAPRSIGPHAGHAWLRRAARAADAVGDVVYGVASRILGVQSLLDGGVPLDECEREADSAIAFFERHRFHTNADRARLFRSFMRGLREPDHERGSLSDYFDEETYEREVKIEPERYYYFIKRMQARYYAGDFEAARDAARRTRELRFIAVNVPAEVQTWLFRPLAEAACGDPANPAEALERMAADEAELDAWSKRGPAMFANKAALVAGERARLEGRLADAQRCFERAADLARQHGIVQEEALAHELAARLYTTMGIGSVARAKLVQARACYVRWGAFAKVGWLDASLSGEESSLALPLGDALDQLDVKVLVSALQAVSSSLQLDHLIDALMKGALQHAGAERGVLVLQHAAAEPRIRAHATSRASAIEVLHDDGPMSSELVPETILRYVLRSADRVSVEDGVLPAVFGGEAYFERQVVRSLLCLPIVVRGKVLGALYLENSLAKQLHGARQLALLELMASQAAVSLENALLYTGLREAQERMVCAERVGRIGSFSWRPDTKAVEFSAALSNIFGLGDRPSVEDLRERIHPEDRALFGSLATETPKHEGKTVQLRLSMPDGTTKHIETVASRIGAEEYVGSVRDVTHERRTEEALQRTQAVLTDVTRIASLGELAAAIAHEVNQPIAGITLNVSTCLRWLAEDRLNAVEARQAALRIRRDADRAASVIQRLRALFGKSESARIPVDLNDAVREVVTLLRSRVREAGATIALELEGELPSALGDRVQLQQVVMNLVTNALDAMKGEAQGTRALVVRTRAIGGERVRCEVRDSGPGVSDADRARVFQPFYSTKLHGMGIGLSISSSILASHGGELSVNGNGDEPGCTFWFELSVVP